MEKLSASVTTLVSGVGDITSLIFNPHDTCFYGCESSTNSIIRIKGIQAFYLSLNHKTNILRD